MPKSVLEKVERYFRFFLWNHDGMRKGVHAVAWDTICKNKTEGCLGIRELKPFHQALMAKLVVWTMADRGTMWAKLVKRKYGANRRSDSFQRKQGCSPVWCVVCLGREIMEQGLRWKINKGIQ